MTRYDLWVFLHVASVIVWLGAARRSPSSSSTRSGPVMASWSNVCRRSPDGSVPASLRPPRSRHLHSASSPYAPVTGALVPGDVTVDADRVVDVGLSRRPVDELPYPGFVDIQLNGCGGGRLPRALRARRPHASARPCSLGRADGDRGNGEMRRAAAACRYEGGDQEVRCRR